MHVSVCLCVCVSVHACRCEGWFEGRVGGEVTVTSSYSTHRPATRRSKQHSIMARAVLFLCAIALFAVAQAEVPEPGAARDSCSVPTGVYFGAATFDLFRLLLLQQAASTTLVMGKSR